MTGEPQDFLTSFALARNANQYVGFGDSITYAEDRGYIPLLENLLLQRYDAAKVWNAGEPGETTAEGLARIERIIAATQSLYMLLMEGTNDVIFLDISMDAAAFNLEEMARKCLRSGMLPLIATIIPRNDWRWYSSVYQNRIFDLNARIRSLASSLGIPIVDQFNVFYDYPASAGGWKSLLLDDGVHPNSKGYEVMAGAWFDELKNQKDVLTLTAPNGGESWQANSTHDIIWTSQGSVGDVRIELSTDGGSTYSDIASSTPNDGSYSWPIPYLSPTGSNCFVRISEASDGTPSDTSDSAFTVAPPPKPKPPLNPALDTRLDTTETKKTSTLTWQANSENAAIPLKNYKVYRKRSGQADSAFALLASVSSTTLQYEDANLEILQKYVYRLTTLATNNDESDPTTSVTETKKFEFPPLNPSVQTGLNRILFYQEKHVTVTFEKNPLNDEAEVSGYELYRRKARENENEFTAIATLDASTFSYKYIIRPPESLTQKYDYALKAVFTDGRKSRFSAVAAEN
jgi:lysophospholipase L1-like esterase